MTDPLIAVWALEIAPVVVIAIAILNLKIMAPLGSVTPIEGLIPNHACCAIFVAIALWMVVIAAIVPIARIVAATITANMRPAAFTRRPAHPFARTCAAVYQWLTATGTSMLLRV